MIEPVLTVWWFRPVLSALRVGEHSAVVWKLLKRRPVWASWSMVGVRMGPPKVRGPAEADVVDQHNHDIGSAFGRLDLEPRRWLGVPRVEFLVSRWLSGSAIGRTVRSTCSCAQPVVAAMASATPRAAKAVTRFMCCLPTLISHPPVRCDASWWLFRYLTSSTFGSFHVPSNKPCLGAVEAHHRVEALAGHGLRPVAFKARWRLRAEVEIDRSIGVRLEFVIGRVGRIACSGSGPWTGLRCRKASPTRRPRPARSQVRAGGTTCRRRIG